MGWKLTAADNDAMVAPHFFKDDCTCADHCKEVARKIRKTDAGYNTSLCFQITDPTGKRWAYTSDHSGWRLRWKRY